MTPTASQPKIHIERMMYRTSIAVPGDSAASYALVKLIPAGGGKGLALNVALVLDVSGSMYEEDGTGVSRLVRIQDAARTAIQKLNPATTKLAVVAFGHDAQVVLPATPLSDKAAVEEVVERIDRFDVDPGGTAMDQGIQMGLAEIEKNHGGVGTLSQMILLTDGETSGERTCRELARQAGEKKIHFTAIGVGTDWNQSLIKDLAKLAEGDWGYIDVNDPGAAERVIVKEFEALAAAGFLNAEMHLRPMKDIKIKRVRMVVPEIKELQVTEVEDRHLVAALGTLERDKPTRYVLDLSLPKRPDGKFRIADLEVTFDPGNGRRESSGAVPLEVTYSASGQGYVNAEVAKHIDEVQIFEANKNLQQAIAADDQEKAVQAAKIIEKKAEVMGPRAAKKTMLAKKVLEEINAGGRVTKKTQLAVDDVARLAEEAPTG
jgi:Ca-activated chloride channel family protein